jgi:hypothetical protein
VGPVGPAGPSALDPDLTHICGINWKHNDSMTTGEIEQNGLRLAFDHEVQSLDIHSDSFAVLGSSQAIPGRDCWCELRGELQAARFKLTAGPNGTCVIAGIEQLFPAGVAPDTPVNGLVFKGRFEAGQKYRVVLNGDFIRDQKGKAVDADHLPGWLPNRKTGDQIEGGMFESWFTTKQG